MRAIIILCLCCLYSCHNDEQVHSTVGKYDSDEITENLAGNWSAPQDKIEPPHTAEPPPPTEFDLEAGSKIIKSGNMEFEVTQLNESKSKVDKFLKSTGGYYESEAYHEYDHRVSYSLTMRIPNVKFDTLVKLLEMGVGELKIKNLNANDVTEEYVDLNVRLENNLAYLKQYKTILAKAKTIEEILDVQGRIRYIEEEIESKKGRIKYLDSKVKYASLNLELSELIEVQMAQVPGFGLQFKNAFRNGYRGFLNFIIVIVNIWPFIFMGLFIYFGRKPLVNRIKSLYKRTKPQLE